MMLKFLSLFIALLVYCMEINAVPRSEFFQYGSAAGDQQLRKEDDGNHDYDLAVPVLFYSKSFSKLDITTNGVIAFGGNRHMGYTPVQFPRTNNIPVIAPFWTDLDTLNGGTVYFRISTSDADAVQRVKSLVADHFADFPNFEAEQVVVTTWDAVAGYSGTSAYVDTFQSVIATDGHNTFTLFLYLDDGINWPNSASLAGGRKVQAGFDAGDGSNFTMIEGSFTNDIVNIAQKSNVGVPGLFIFKINGVVRAAEPSPSPIPIIPTSTAAPAPVLPTVIPPIAVDPTEPPLPSLSIPPLPILTLPPGPIFTQVVPSFSPLPSMIPVEPPVPIQPRPEVGSNRCYEEVIKLACRQLLDAASSQPQPVIAVGEPVSAGGAPAEY